MRADVLLYVASIVTILWGVAHIVPTKPVIAGFGSLNTDNRRILIMEWVAEGLTLCFIGTLTLLATVLLDSTAPGAVFVYRASAVMLLVMAAWTMITAGRGSVVQFKICPFVKTGAATLLLIGSA